MQNHNHGMQNHNGVRTYVRTHVILWQAITCVRTNGLLSQLLLQMNYVRTSELPTYVQMLLHINYRSLRHHRRHNRRAPSMMAGCSFFASIVSRWRQDVAAFLPPLSVVRCLRSYLRSALQWAHGCVQKASPWQDYVLRQATGPPRSGAGVGVGILGGVMTSCKSQRLNKMNFV